MRRAALDAPSPARERSDFAVIGTLLPYLWAWKWRVVFALTCLIAAKFANVGVPLILKGIVDALTLPTDKLLLTVPIALIIAYGVARLMTSVFTELR
ncbi:MAG: metal ABC transporter permease, partial [Burkholderiaceae bacterium]